MCQGVNFEQRNLGGCASLLLSWAYHRIHACRPQGNFDETRFPLVERSRGFRMPRDPLGPRVWGMILNGIDHRGISVSVEWTPYDAPAVQAIVPGETRRQMGRRRGRGEWYPMLQGWYDMWRGRAHSRLDLEMAVKGVLPSRQYLLWYYQWAHMILTGYRDPLIPAPGVIPDYARNEISKAPDMVQPEDGELPATHPRVTKRRRAPAGRSRGRGQAGPDGSPARADEPQ
ncbi:hypothetical protein PIB30_067491 [Stylosanthes scabra]|uniref:Aminotransferase-like plant mobile domain-containing protein n=1 Tax=Stylosanthes scabra TaxID=79078 RepID=A0ABU6ZLE2_9FABA|nr:hypothetical protein [Stylosanthes scabra]